MSKKTVTKVSTIGEFVVSILNKEPKVCIKTCIELVKKQFPESAFNVAHVGWYRNHFKYKTLSNKLNLLIDDKAREKLVGLVKSSIVTNAEKTLKPKIIKVKKEKMKKVQVETTAIIESPTKESDAILSQ